MSRYPLFFHRWWAACLFIRKFPSKLVTVASAHGVQHKVVRYVGGNYLYRQTNANAMPRRHKQGVCHETVDTNAKAGSTDGEWSKPSLIYRGCLKIFLLPKGGSKGDV